MKNKILKLFGFVLIAQISLFACCGDDFNVFITSYDFSANDDADDDSSSVTNADFFLELSPSYQVEMASLLSKDSGFINTANATSCDDVYTVIKRVETITLTANVSLFDIPAGESLNNHVIVEYQYNEGTQNTMNDLLLALNSNLSDFESYFTFDTEIPAETNVNFTLTIVFENDEQLMNTTSTVTFE
ncbi:hypothetical protein [uncultured Kordia sp.]|uniref:hypothetical protein n=1 Tax=uncultured Kordia sp. TaxID=507699 RepID=UPI0026301001|nr:hypothetical protein [uncultured Kordia sp.]